MLGHQELFALDEKGQPTSVAGVPPDYFSADGQLWGNPLYDYDRMAKDHYDWWVQRFRYTFRLVDEVRLDHFRGLEAFWSVPATAKTARAGKWVKAPGAEILKEVRHRLGNVRIVAEDLGIITDEVCDLRTQFRLPGMRVLQFHLMEGADGLTSFDTEPNCLAYTGTHDNNTTRGWYENDLDDDQRHRLCRMLHMDDDTSGTEITGALIEYLYSRRAETVIVPLQDALALPAGDRMNIPGTATGNWHWQLKDGQLRLDTARWLSQLCRTYNR